MTRLDPAAWFTFALVLTAGWCLQPRPRSRRVTASAEHESPSAVRRRTAHHVPIRRAVGLTTTRRRRTGAGHLAQWCDDLARSVRGGSTLTTALRSSLPVGEPSVDRTVADLVHRLDRGQCLTDALLDRSVHDDSTRPPAARADLELVLNVLEQCATAGGSSAEPLERAAAVLRSRDAARGEIAAQSASARLSAVVLTLLPVAMLLMLLTVSGSTRAAIGSPVGLGVLVAGLALNLVGWRWMRRLIGAAT